MTKDLLPKALELFVGSAVSPIREGQLLASGRVESTAVFSFSSSPKLTTILKGNGYTHFHSFAAIPSGDEPYWLLPTEHASGISSATHIYEPYKWRARVMKRILIQMMRIGWKGWSRSNVLVASRDRLPMENLVHEITGERRPVFAFSLGRQAAVRKLTIQIMRPGGEILGYMKLPLIEAAIERVRNETRILERLSAFPALQPRIPKLLYAGDWCGTYVLFQSALEGKRGPAALNGMHENFLRTLWDAHMVEIPLQSLVNALSVNWEKAARDLGGEWERLGREVLRRSIREDEVKALRCGVMHGDFAPWNTRVRQKQLLLFDWESAEWESPIEWDSFHFQIQAAYSFRNAKRFQIPIQASSARISFMLFLLNSVCRFTEEKNHVAIAHYKKLLTNVFDGGQPWLEARASAA